MAKFTSTSQLNIWWRGIWEFNGAAGTQFSIPDTLYDEFNGEMTGIIPGLTWVSTQDEVSLPIAQANVTNLTTDLASKFDKTGGIISGAVTATGAFVSPNIRAKGEPHYNVKAYGALGDNSTDDTSALQSAINAVPTGGGTVYFPPGTYKHTGLTLGPHVSLYGHGTDATVLYSSTGGISFTGTTNSPETGWNRQFVIENLTIQHVGATAAALTLNTCINWQLSNLIIQGLGSAGGNGLDIIDSYFGILRGVRSWTFPSGSAIRYYSTGLTQPGQVIFDQVVAIQSSIGIEVNAASNIIDALSFDACVVTSNTSRGFSVTTTGGGKLRNLRFQNLHIETGISSNTQTGFYASGDIKHLVVDGVFFWGVQTPMVLSGTILDVSLRGILASANSVSSPGAVLTVGSSVTNLELGYLEQSGYSAISDSSQALTRRQIFAGGPATSVIAATALTSISQSTTSVPGFTYTATPVYSETWTVIATIDCEATSAGTGYIAAYIVLDGATTGQPAVFSPGTTDVGRATVSTTVVISPSISAHTIRVDVKKQNAGGTAQVNANTTRLLILRSTA